MKWTTEKPTEEGWYWVRVAGDNTGIRKVSGQKIVLASGYKMKLSSVQPGTQFAGPIPHPED